MPEPTRDEVNAWPGRVVLEFGTSTCEFCAEARPLIDRALAEHPGVRHVKIEDGPGRPLGRSFKVLLWPTLILLKDGVVVAKSVRPRSNLAIGRAFDKLD